MKKKKVVSLFILLVLAAGGLGVLHKAHQKKPIDPASIVEVALDKEQVLANSQHFDAQGIPDYIVKRFDGKQAFFMEQLDDTLDDVKDLLTEIRTAFVEGRVKGIYNVYAGGTNATIKTPTTKVHITWLSEDGTFGSCTKVIYSNGQEVKKEELGFYGDHKTLRSYRAPGRFLLFSKEGILAAFSINIDDRTHEIFWNLAGQISNYLITDIRPQNPSEKI